MVVLNFYGKIDPICISNKLKIYISNLPSDEPDNNWQHSLEEDLKCGIKSLNLLGEEIGTEPLEKLYSKVFHEKKIQNFDDDTIYKELTQNMICIYFDYSYEDMPLGDWKTNCFDGRFCEDDCAEKFINFLQYIDSPSMEFFSYPRPVPYWIYSSNYDRVDYSRLYHGGDSAAVYIDCLKKWGNLIDSFLSDKNDYLLLDYLFNSLYKDNEYNEYHLLKAFSLCQLFLEKDHEYELDHKLIDFMENDTQENKKISAKYFRKLRNKIAHGDFVEFEKLVEEYAQKVLDGRMAYDYTEYSRKNWVILHVCCELDSVVKKLILMLFNDPDKLREIKNSR